MTRRNTEEPDTETVIVERSGAGAIIGVILLVVVALALLHYFGLLPI